MKSHEWKGAFLMVDFQPKSSYTVQDLVCIVELLRDPQEGCPWDIEQTHESIRMNFIEETYEAVDAIDQKDAHLLCEELGDVMLQVVLHSQMEAEQNAFTFDDVCDGICKKLVYRHPHVFGDTAVASTSEALENWEALKNKEKARATAKDRLESVPRCFPALMRASKLQKRAAEYGFGNESSEQVLQSLKQKIEELEQQMKMGQKPEQQMGEVLFAAAGLARSFHLDPEEVLTDASDRFEAHVIQCEESAEKQ